MPFEKNENVVDLDIKEITNVDSQLSEEDIDFAWRLMKKDKNNVTIYGPILVRFKTLVKETTYLKIKRILLKLNST